MPRRIRSQGRSIRRGPFPLHTGPSPFRRGWRPTQGGRVPNGPGPRRIGRCPGRKDERTLAEPLDRGAVSKSPVWYPTRQGFNPPRGASDGASRLLDPTRRAVEGTRVASAPLRQDSDGNGTRPIHEVKVSVHRVTVTIGTEGRPTEEGSIPIHEVTFRIDDATFRDRPTTSRFRSTASRRGVAEASSRFETAVFSNDSDGFVANQ